MGRLYYHSTPHHTRQPKPTMSTSPVNPQNSQTGSQSPTVSPTVSSVSSSVSPTVDPKVVVDIVQFIPLRIVIGAVWLYAFSAGLSFSTVMQGFATFALNSFTCIGLFSIFAIISFPIAYAIHPEFVVRFKFGSLAPVFAVGLYKLDYLVNRAVRYANTKRSAR